MTDDSSGQAGATDTLTLRDKLAPKVVKQCDNTLAHRLKRINDRLSFKALDIAEGYIEGRLDICVHLRSRCCGEDFHIIVRRGELKEVVSNCGRREPENGREGFVRLVQVPGTGFGVWNGDKALAPWGAEAKHETAFSSDSARLSSREAELDGLQQSAVLVPIVELIDRIERFPRSALVRLGIEKEFYDGPGEMFFLLRENVFKFIERTGCGEFYRLHTAPGHMNRGVSEGSRKHLVQRSSKVVHGIGGYAFDIPRDWIDSNAPNLLCSLIIELGRETVRARFEEGADCGMEILDVGFGPSNFG